MGVKNESGRENSFGKTDMPTTLPIRPHPIGVMLPRVRIFAMELVLFFCLLVLFSLARPIDAGLPPEFAALSYSP